MGFNAIIITLYRPFQR